MTHLKHLKKLSTVKSNTGVKFLTPAAFPGNHCPLHTALALSANVKGMSTLVIGTAECGTYSRNVISKVKNAGDALHWMYVLDANEVVFGCRKGLMEAIREMDKAGAKAIMLILTCVPEVIGEDIEGIVHELQPHITARLCHVLMGHFKCNSYPSGYWKTLTALGALMEQKPAQSNTINILGRSVEEDHTPMPHLLQALEAKGFHLRMLAPKSDIQDFIVAPDARLNLVLSPFMNPLAEMMQQRWQLPFVSLHETYDLAQVQQMYDAVAQALGFAWPQDQFAQAHEQAAQLQEQVRPLFAGKSYVSAHVGALNPLPLAVYLAQLGLRPLLLHLDEFYPDDRRWAKLLCASGHDPLVCNMVNDQADGAAIAQTGADFCLGELQNGTAPLPNVAYPEDLYGWVGYERTSLLLQKMLQTARKTGLLPEGSN